MRIHPFANLFPMYPDEEIQRLADDIAKHGLRQPIIIDADEKILDGRNRAAACAIAQVKPIYEPFVGTEAEKLAFVISANIHRRHLTTQQRAEIAATIATMCVGDNQHSTNEEDGSNEPPSKRFSIKDASKLMNVSPSSVKRAKARKRTAEPGRASAAEQRKDKPAAKPQPKRKLVAQALGGQIAPEVKAEAISLFSKESTTAGKPDELCIEGICQHLFDTLSPVQLEHLCENIMDKLGWRLAKKDWKRPKDK